MNAHAIAILLLGGVSLAVVVWVLHKIGKALVALFEALATIAVVFVALWGLTKATAWLVRQVATHWRTSLTLLAATLWCQHWGWASLAFSLGLITVMLLGWRAVDVVSFDGWVGGWLRAWWQRWTIYAPKLPEWLHACGLSVPDITTPAVVSLNLLGRPRLRRSHPATSARLPKVVGVKSGPSWDQVRVRLVPGQKPEDFDEATRALASARGVARCQVRERQPNMVSIDFQRRDLLADPVACPDLSAMASMAGSSVDLRRVWAGRNEYGQDWYIPLTGPASHSLTAGGSGAGKNSYTWCPLVSIAPAIRDGLVRVSGIDPKGMELAYGRGIFHRYAVTGHQALDILDDLVAAMDARKALFAGQVRTVPISTEHPLEIVEFDKIGALTKYTDRKTREAISEKSRCWPPKAERWASPCAAMSKNRLKTPSR